MHEDTARRAVAIVGMSAIMPEAPDAAAFWENIAKARYSVTDVPPERWDPALYYDPDPAAVDKTYSKIGGWVREFEWNPLAWRLPIPPKVGEQMDDGQKWAINLTRAALMDAGWPQRPIDGERTAVILGNALAGEKHYETYMRICFPEVVRELRSSPTFATLPSEVKEQIIAEAQERWRALSAPITEDTMPGELANVIAGRVANLFDFRGPNYVTDAACASGMAAMNAAVEGLVAGQYDAAITGGIDRNMGVAAFVKFCKIGALSATGTRPYADGADGFVMGEGGAVFLLKRLADAERDGDRVYAVIRGMAGSSDGKGKGITAPNPAGQRLAVERAWRNAGIDPSTASLVEGHGTSTRVGDVVEVEALQSVFGAGGARPGSIPLGSVKSNIGHLKGAAGSAGVFKVAMALAEKVLPPSVGCHTPNPAIDWASSVLTVNTELRDWPRPPSGVRSAGVSAFGFGGTNFHTVLEEHVPGRLSGNGSRVHASVEVPQPRAATVGVQSRKAPLRGAHVIGGDSSGAIADQLEGLTKATRAGSVAPPAPPDPALAGAPVRVAIDYGDADELAAKAAKAATALRSDNAALWKMLRAQGVFLGAGTAAKVAFLYTGQGSQYVNMLAELRAVEPIVADAFAEADRIMTPLLGRPLSSYIFIDGDDPEAVAQLNQQLLQTEITQPAVLTIDLALTRLLGAYGIAPDMVMGHSLGEYGALVAAGALDFAAALEAVSARGQEMAHIAVEDNGAMAAVFAPLPEIEAVVDATDGYVVLANINSSGQAVIGGATAAVEAAVAELQARGHTAMRIPVSHAFHTSIVAPATEPLKDALRRLDLHGPVLPIVANVTGELYPSGASVDELLDLLGRQVASPVQFVKGLHTLYDAGARVYVEVGPKKALHGFVEDVLGTAHDDVLALFTNHPKQGDVVAFNQALCGLYASGHGFADVPQIAVPATEPPVAAALPVATEAPLATAAQNIGTAMHTDRYTELGRLFADFLDQGRRIWETGPQPVRGPGGNGDRSWSSESIVITGAGLGLPGVERVFDDTNVARLLGGESFIDLIPSRLRQTMVDKHITRLVKKAGQDPVFEAIDSPAEVIKLAGRRAPFDVVEEFGVEAERAPALDMVTCLAIGAGYDALRNAGIPLVRQYKTTSVGSQLPDRWALPVSMRDDTGVVFASAFPGYDAFADDLNAYQVDRARREQREVLRDLRARMRADDPAAAEADRRIAELDALLEAEPFLFDRRFLFKSLSMGHAQFAELIGARGPNTQVNAACASTTQAVAIAEDWIRAGRCRRVIVISADDVTSDSLMPWAGSGFLASGAAATDDVVEEAALPFDRRRHGMIMGMGAAALVVETAAAARERGIQPICEVVASVTANSAFHGTRLDVAHVCQVMETLLRQAEARGVDRAAIAPRTVFVSHETYTPARGGSAAAEIEALRHVFGPRADDVVITNTKGFTGHAMGAGVEDVVAVKALETGVVPPVANFKEIDPALGNLNLSRGGAYDVEYALRLAAGFGSQISMTLLRWTPAPDRARRHPSDLGFEGRLVSPQTWQSWLQAATGVPGARLEVDKRRLRVVDDGPPAVAPALAAAGPAATVTPTVATAATAAAPAAAAVPAGAPVAPVVRTAPPATAPALVPDMPVPAPAAQPAPAATVAAAAQPVAASEPAPLLSAAATEQPVADPVVDRVLGLVSVMTGYPPDLLDLDLDLEADLGVDTVKQAEVFAAVREEFAIERDEDLKLRDFPTLTHVVGFVRDRATNLTASDSVAGGAPAAAAAAAPAAEAAPTAPSPEAAGDGVEATVLSVVADMTGYPPDLLDLDLDLEADLGVDTVKQAEVFAAVREEFGIERVEDLQLRDFPTLRHVIGFVHDRAPDLASAAAATDTEATDTGANVAPTVRVHTAPAVTGDLAATDRIARRVPVPIVRPDLEQCRPTGVSIDADARILVMRDEGGVGKALERRLSKLGAAVLTLEPGIGTDDLHTTLDGWLADGPITGVYWLAALDEEGPLADLDLDAWREALRRRVKNLYATMRRLVDTDAFLVSATRLGGYHGYGAAGALAPLGGAVTGFTKACKRERPDTLAKAVDLPRSRKTRGIADILVDETLADPGAVEIGRPGGARFGVGLREVPFGDGEGGMTLDAESVFCVTGAAGSIVSAITADLATASGGVFHLLDLTPEPDPADPDLASFITDTDGFKAVVTERMKAAGERPTPVLIERELARYERLQMALAAIQAVTDAGGQVHYHSVDLTDGPAVAAVVDDIAERHGRIDVLLHAAGLEISRGLADKEPREYDLVFDVKSDGWFNLLSAAGDLPIGATIGFSSIAGRFGNAGQTDYSAANDLLCKIASSFRTTRSATRAIALDWTAWGGIGMATRGSIPKIMEMAGIDMLPPEAGIAWIRRELIAGDGRGEVVVAGSLGILTAEQDPTGGLDVDAIDVAGAGPMVARAVAFTLAGGLVVEADLDPAEQPFLADHQIEGTPVLPGVMGIEGFAEAARLLAPDRHVTAVEDVAFLAPFKFYRDEPRTVTITARLRPDGDDLVADCRLLGVRTLANQDAPQETTHFTGSVRLSTRPAAQEKADVPSGADGVHAGPDAIYGVYFHGPAYRVLSDAWRANGGPAGRFATDLPPNHRPEDAVTLTAPRLLELCFQTSGLWEIGRHGRMALPHRIRRVQLQPGASEASGPLYAVAQPRDDGFDCAVVDDGGRIVMRLEGYRTVELPGGVPDEQRKPLQAAMS
jgi:acyl transferase domain-containing protein/acyl carrier protein